MYAKEKTSYLLNPNVIKQQHIYAHHTRNSVSGGGFVAADADTTIAAATPKFYPSAER